MLAFTASIVSTVLAPLWRMMLIETVGTPLSVAIERRSLVPSSARPMSFTRMGTPFFVVMTMSLKVAGSRSLPIVRSVRSTCSPVTNPPGTSAFWRSSASRTAVMGI
jgi:hypothetical protein